MAISNQRMHLQLLRLKNDAGSAFGRNAVDPRVRASGSVNVGLSVGGDRPNVRGGRGDKLLERGRQFQRAIAANGNTLCGAFFKLLEFRLTPGLRAFGQGKRCDQKNESELPNAGKTITHKFLDDSD